MATIDDLTKRIAQSCNPEITVGRLIRSLVKRGTWLRVKLFHKVAVFKKQKIAIIEYRTSLVAKKICYISDGELISVDFVHDEEEKCLYFTKVVETDHLIFDQGDYLWGNLLY